MIRFSDRTRRGLVDAILLPGVLGGTVALVLILVQWLGVGV